MTTSLTDFSALSLPALAQTGSGKPAAFALALLINLNTGRLEVRP